jgi:hypothetical protein
MCIGLCCPSCELMCLFLCVTLNSYYRRKLLTDLYFVNKDGSFVGLCYKYRISVLSSVGNSVHLLQIKRTRSLMIGSEHDRVGYAVYCALVHKAPFVAGRNRRGTE